MSVIAGSLSVIVFLGSVQAASAWHLEKVAPEKGCSGETITFTGTSFANKGQITTVNWTDPTAQQLNGDNLGETVSTNGTVTVSGTTATAIVPLLLQVQGSGVGSVEIGGSLTKTFTFNDLQNCFKGQTGATGPTGKEGVAGATGAAGVAGAAGATGAAGVAGAAGATGAAGVAGAAGATGEPGAAGVAGATGAQGVAGATGATGDTGATGEQGVAGATGEQGVAGFVGPTGAPGSTGPAGPTEVTRVTGTSVTAIEPRHREKIGPATATCPGTMILLAGGAEIVNTGNALASVTKSLPSTTTLGGTWTSEATESPLSSNKSTVTVIPYALCAT